jgi:tRNA(Ile)-lysidine synthase
MSLLSRFTNHIQKENLFQKKDNLIVAVSGGIDSVVLCELCYQLGFHFEIAHCNFQLRGEESERDEKFVRELAGKYNVLVNVKKFETEKYAQEQRIGIQEAARDLRYDWFKEICFEELFESAAQGGHFFQDSAKPKACVLTAHHANDNIETLLMNFFKGTGINGLQAIPARKEFMPWIVRPLLFAKKEEILDFGKENNLAFVEDSSNLTDKYTRNYFRNQLIPSLQKVFPQVEENLISNIERFKDIKALYRQAVDLHKKKLIEYKGSEAHISVLKLLKQAPLQTIIYEIIKDFGFTAHQCDDVINLLKSESGKYISSATHKIIKNRKWIIIAPHNSMESFTILIDEDDREIEFEQGRLKLERITKEDFQMSDSQNIANIDADQVTFPLLLRKWKQGDYFYPLGMKRKKKLSRFFIDRKMSLTEKEKIWVIENKKKIFWIVGKRIDERFKVTGKTMNMLKIYFKEL